MNNRIDKNIRLRVAAYFRKSPASPDAVEASIEQQIKQVREYADQMGWIIVAEYTDGGISGSGKADQDLRVHFLQMIDDSKNGQWSAVLTWHTNRFARLDIIDIGKFVGTLRDNGVHLETVRQGRIDPSTPEGRMALFMYSEGDSAHSKNISADSLRGRDSAMAAGYWPHGNIPWGYDRQLYDTQGNPHEIVKRRTKSRKPVKWHVKLVVDPVIAETIRWMYDSMEHRDATLRGLAKMLTDRAVMTPTGTTLWSVRSIVNVMTNPVYAGTCTIGIRQNGGKRGKFNSATPSSVDSVPPIVSKTTWDAVQWLMASRRATGRKSHSDRSGALSGVLICGHCGHRMVRKQRVNEFGVPTYYYKCISRQIRPGASCSQWRVDEKMMIDTICKLLVECVDGEVVRRMQAHPERGDTGEVDRLTARRDELESQINRGSANLLLADSDIFPMLQARLAELRHERDRTLNTLELLTTGTDSEMDRFTAWWEKQKGRLVKVRDGQPLELVKRSNGKASTTAGAMMDVLDVMTTPAELRGWLHKLSTTVTLFWTPDGKRHFRLEKGFLRSNVVSAKVSGDRSIPD